MIELLITIGALLAAGSALPYIKDTLRGKTKPKLVSWAIWAVLSMLMTAAAFSAGLWSSAVLSAISAISCACVAFLAMHHGVKTIQKIDIICLIGAVVGIVAWKVTNDPIMAIIIAVSIDIVAYIPTLVHGWQAPHEESWPAYAIASVAGGMLVVAGLISGGGVPAIIYPLYSLVFNGAMVFILLWPRDPQLRLQEEY